MNEQYILESFMFSIQRVFRRYFTRFDEMFEWKSIGASRVEMQIAYSGEKRKTANAIREELWGRGFSNITVKFSTLQVPNHYDSRRIDDKPVAIVQCTPPPLPEDRVVRTNIRAYLTARRRWMSIKRRHEALGLLVQKASTYAMERWLKIPPEEQLKIQEVLCKEEVK